MGEAGFIHMRLASKSQQDQFLKQCLVAVTIDFPTVAQKLQLDWFKQVKPLWEGDDDFRARMKEMLERLEYQLMQKMLDVALGGGEGNVAFLKATIEQIRKMIGRASEEENEGPREKREEVDKRHLSRLGIE